jgi:Flp pilus assembly protein TadG
LQVASGADDARRHSVRVDSDSRGPSSKMVNPGLTERVPLLRWAKHFNNHFQIVLAGRLSLPTGDFSMPSSAISTATVRNILRRFRRNRRGSAAVEFALVAPVFFALLFAIIETAFMFFASQVLETIAQNSARMVLTGQVQAAAYTQPQFKTYVCGQIPALFDCNGIYVDVRSYGSSFTGVTINSQIDANANFINNMQYSPGGPGDVVVVRLFYQWPLFVTGLGYNIANLSGGMRLLTAAAAFRNEPY